MVSASTNSRLDMFEGFKKIQFINHPLKSHFQFTQNITGNNQLNIKENKKHINHLVAL